MNDIAEYRRLKFLDALRFVLALAVYLAVIAFLAFSGGCAAVPVLPAGAYDIVTNAAQRAVVVLHEARDPATTSTEEHEENGEGAQASSDSPASPSSPVLLFRYGGFDGSKAAEDPATQIGSLKVSSSTLSYKWVKGNLGNWGLAKEDAGALACAFYQDPATDRWIGGKFEWVSTSRTSRGLNNIRDGYGGWDPNAFFSAKKHAFCIVSADGRRRTNLITD